MPTCRALSALLLVTVLAVPAAAAGEEQDFELKVVELGAAPVYTESFPTEVEVTARLWNRLKIDALEEQTQALQIEFERFKTVRFERQPSLANQTGNLAAQYQPQPEHYPAFMVTGVRW
jgi:hypothetical protein